MKGIVRPAMVPDLKPHPVELGHILPVHEIGRIVHPGMGYEKRSAESFFFQEGCYVVQVGLYRIVKGQHHDLLAPGMMASCKKYEQQCRKI